MMDVEAPAPVGRYKPYVRAGNLLFLSAISSARGGELITGKVGRDIDLATAREVAERAARNLLAVLLDAVDGDAERIGRVVMVRGHVNAAEDFSLVHRVIDAASDVLIAVLGDKGQHARTAIGCAALPNGNAVTLEAIVMLASD